MESDYGVVYSIDDYIDDAVCCLDETTQSKE
jgi:hypothetical protein